MANVKVTATSIRKILKNYSSKQAIAEYIWNGFDAKADTIWVDYSAHELDSLTQLVISDNGTGIDYEKLSIKFHPFYDSEKAITIATPKHTSAMHGKNGVGRLTFFTFAGVAKWRSVAAQNNTLVRTDIAITAEGLNTYTADLHTQVSDTVTGTRVSFHELSLSQQDMEQTILPFLVQEFCWFLELHKEQHYQIIINGVALAYNSNIIAYEDELQFDYTKSNTQFKVKFVQWKNPLHSELSKYYFLNKEGKELYKEYTSLNKKSDEFYHSIYIQSDFFTEFDFWTSETKMQADLFGKAKSSPEYKFLIKALHEYLRERRKPFLHVYANKLIAQYAADGILPVYKSTAEETHKKPRLQHTLTGLYEVQPKLFASLNTEQKKVFVHLLDLLLSSNQRSCLLDLVTRVVELEPEEELLLAEYFKEENIEQTLSSYLHNTAFI